MSRASKYEDLADEINLHVPGRGSHYYPDDDTQRDRRSVLKWLDKHPEDIPGPTVADKDN